MALLADVYHCQITDLLDLDDWRALPDGDVRVLRRGPTDPGPAADPSAAQSASRHPVVPSPTPPSTPRQIVAETATESARWALWAEGSNVGELALDQISADVRTLAADYLDGDPVQLFHRTRDLRDQVFRLLQGHQAPRQSVDLYVVAGYLCGLLAWMSSDLGDLASAETQGRTAWLCADLAGHDELRAWVCSTRSKTALWDGRLQDAVRHARHGGTLPVRGTVGVLLACQEADAWSLLGEPAEAQAALDRASTARDGVRADDEVSGLFSCPPARMVNYAAAVHVRGGRHKAALAETADALQFLSAQPVRAYGTEAQIHINRGRAFAGAGEPDGALEAVLPVLRMAPELRLEPVTRRMRELASTLATSPAALSATATDTRAMLEDWCAGSIAPRRLALSPGRDTAWLDARP